MKLKFTIIMMLFLSSLKAQETPLFSPDMYVSIQPLATLLGTPNLQVGFKSGKEKIGFLNFEVNYPLLAPKSLSYFTSSLFDVELEKSLFIGGGISYRMMRKSSNNFWAPLIDVNYQYIRYRELTGEKIEYKSLPIGIGVKNGRFYHKGKSTFHCLFYGLGVAMDLLYSERNLFTRRIEPRLYLGWEFGIVKK